MVILSIHSTVDIIVNINWKGTIITLKLVTEIM